MYSSVLLALSLAIFVLLLQVQVLLAVAFFIAALIFIPSLVLHRREAASAIEYGSDTESHGRGLMRLVGLLSMDLTGIAIGTLIFLLSIVLMYLASGHH